MTQSNDIKEKIKYFSEKIAEEPNNAEHYIMRGFSYLIDNDTDKFQSDIAKAKELDYAEFLAFQGLLYISDNNYDEALDNYNQAIEQKPEKADFYKKRANLLVKMKKYDQALKDYDQAIKLNPSLAEAYIERGNLLKERGDNEKAVADYSAALNINQENPTILKERRDLYLALKEPSLAFKDTTNLFELDPYFEVDGYNLEGNVYLMMQLKDKIHEEEKLRATLAERNKIIANLSHVIKNLISTVIDPLEDLKTEKVVKPQVIDNAIRGASLIREIVNAMNLSFHGSVDDFRYDVEHNTGSEKQDVKTILLEALKHSVSNMFDGKYFNNFMRKYFPEKSAYVEAKSEWAEVSRSNEPSLILPVLQKYFFETDIDFNNAEDFIIGNEKGSVLKLLILCQELILNAVKYCVFVEKGKRFLKIAFKSDDNSVSIRVENPYDNKVQTKTSGIGHVIVKNFASLLRTEPTVTENDHYAVEIKFANFWKETAR